MLKPARIIQKKHVEKLKRTQEKFKQEPWIISFIDENMKGNPNIHLFGEVTQKKEESKEFLGFIQMKLPIDKIDLEYEESLRAKVKENGINPIIEKAQPHELLELLNVYNRSFMTSNTPFEPTSIDIFEGLYDIPEVTFYSARLYGIAAGFTILDFEGDNKEFGYITALRILPRFQGRGIGKLLGLTAWNHFRNQGVEELRCEVYIQNMKSMSFLKTLLFEEFAIR